MVHASFCKFLVITLCFTSITHGSFLKDKKKYLIDAIDAKKFNERALHIVHYVEEANGFAELLFYVQDELNVASMTPSGMPVNSALDFPLYYFENNERNCKELLDYYKAKCSPVILRIDKPLLEYALSIRNRKLILFLIAHGVNVNKVKKGSSSTDSDRMMLARPFLATLPLEENQQILSHQIDDVMKDAGDVPHILNCIMSQSSNDAVESIAYWLAAANLDITQCRNGIYSVCGLIPKMYEARKDASKPNVSNIVDTASSFMSDIFASISGNSRRRAIHLSHDDTIFVNTVMVPLAYRAFLLAKLSYIQSLFGAVEQKDVKKTNIILHHLVKRYSSQSIRIFTQPFGVEVKETAAVAFNVTNAAGETLFHVAMRTGDRSILTLLVEWIGLWADAPNSQGQTFVECALAYHYGSLDMLTYCFELLQAHK